MFSICLLGSGGLVRKSDIVHRQPKKRWFLKYQTEECYLFIYSMILILDL